MRVFNEWRTVFSLAPNESAARLLSVSSELLDAQIASTPSALFGQCSLPTDLIWNLMTTL
jgi:hypothetical protein